MRQLPLRSLSLAGLHSTGSSKWPVLGYTRLAEWRPE